MTDQENAVRPPKPPESAAPIPREALLRLPEVKRLTGYSTTTIYEHMDRGAFPLAVHLGPRAVAWQAGEVLDWIAARPRVARSTNPMKN